MAPKKRKVVAADGDGVPGELPGESLWSSKTVAILRKECSSRGLGTDGLKKDLVQRLIQSDQEEGVEVEEEDVSPPKVKKVAAPRGKKADKKVTTGKSSSSEETADKKVDAIKKKPDSGYPNADSVEVYQDYDCMLNQTNIKDNNNKFYVLQVLKDKKKEEYVTWTRWGRVGEQGQSKASKFSDVNACVKDFQKKFKEKTKNDWADRDNFVPHDKKYTLIEITADDGDGESAVDAAIKMKKAKDEEMYAECTLDEVTQQLVDLIFSTDMFNSAMEDMNLDIKKMPLGKLSKVQIDKGFDALIEIQDAINEAKDAAALEKLSSRFYTVIPHSFGRSRPPVIGDLHTVKVKMDMMNVLQDIALAQSMQKEEDFVTKREPKAKDLKPHPLDEKYALLHCDLEPLPKKSEEFKTIDTYFKNTGVSHYKLENVWKVRREMEAHRFKEHDGMDNRKLLWHGTNVAVVAAILKEGLRIMPHSGGRVGKGLYFASECSKSAGYVCTSRTGQGVMFLNEVALGKEKSITMDDSGLIKPPKGFDSVVARGQTEPDPSKDKKLKMENGKTVVVPLGKPLEVTQYKGSNFSQSEYLVYRESQACVRYLLTIATP